MNMAVISKRVNRVKQKHIVLFKTEFTRCRHILKTVKNVTDMPSGSQENGTFYSGRF